MMRLITLRLVFQAGLFVWGTAYAAAPALTPYSPLLSQLRLPAGFNIAIYADNLPNARSLALGDGNTVFVGTGREGKVYAIPDRNGYGIPENPVVIDSGLEMPNGVAYKDGALYVALINRILRYDNINQHLDNPPKPSVVYDQFPSDRHHGWKYLRFGPDGKLYTAIGAPCNICNPRQTLYTSLVRLNPEGSGLEILHAEFATLSALTGSPRPIRCFSMKTDVIILATTHHLMN